MMTTDSGDGMQRMREPKRVTGREENRFTRAYYGSFVIALLICWSPFKALAYLTPPLALAWYAIVSKSCEAKRRAAAWLIAWLTVILLHALFSSAFSLTGALLAILTYGTFAVIFAIPNREIGNKILLARMLRAVAFVLVIESTIGVVQATYGAFHSGTFDVANGDRVEGTIHPGFSPDTAFANPMFAANIALMLLALFPVVVITRRWRYRFLLGATAFVLASVVHMLIFLAVALMAGLFLYRPPILSTRTKFFAVFALCIVPALCFLLLRSNFETFVPIVQETLNGSTPRAIVAAESVVDLPKDYRFMPWVGLGPGQFSSRAALIPSGLYLGGANKPRPVPLLSAQSSKTFQDYMEDLLFAAASNPFWGSSQKPFFSWLSVYTEMGLPIVILILWVAAKILIRVRQMAQTSQQRLFATALGAGVIFFLLLGIQENYWEIPQAILVGALLMKAVYATFFADKEMKGQTTIRKDRVAAVSI